MPGTQAAPRAHVDDPTLGRRLFAFFGTIARSVLPVPDLPSRLRVRSLALRLARQCEPWQDLAATDLDGARLALVRLRSLQVDVRRSVRRRQGEATAALARIAIETVIAGLYCVHHPGAVSEFQAADVRQLPPQLRSFARAMKIPEAAIRQCIADMDLGEPSRGPSTEAMATAIDQALKLSAPGATELYDAFYRPLSAFTVHAGASALMRFVDDDSHRLRRRPEARIARRTPARIADSCVGILTAVIARETGIPSKRAENYARRHLDRAMPPILVSARSGLMSVLVPSRVMRTKSLITAGFAAMRDPDPQMRVVATRSLTEMLTEISPDLPPGALGPIIELLAAQALDSDESARA